MLHRVWWPVLAASFLLATDIACGVSDDAGNVAAAPPTLTSVTPAQISARGGDVLTLHGSEFAAGITVQFGDASAESVKVVSPTELTVTAPPLFAGPVTIKTAGTSGTAELTNAVTVLALDLRFVQAPSYSLTLTNDFDAGADAATDQDAGPSPPLSAAASADFDGDGDSDLVTCAATEECHFLANDGKGNFADTSSDGTHFASGSMNAVTLVTDDFDGDGDRDLVVAPASGFAVIETNGGTARFSESPLAWTQVGDGGAAEEDGGSAAIDPVTAMASGDLDGDGKPDLVVGNATGAGAPFRIFKNTSSSGAIRFLQSAPGVVPTRDWAVRGIALGDVDGNGSVDIVVATPGSADHVELRLLLGDKGIFTEAHGGLPNVVDAQVTALAMADVNGDGAIDIVAAGKGQDRLLINDGSGHFFDSSSTSMPLDDTTATSMMLVDLDRDRDLDLIIGNQGAVTRLYLNDGTGVFGDATPVLPIAADDAAWVHAADVDGDSDQDIFVFSAAPTVSRLYLSVESLP